MSHEIVINTENLTYHQIEEAKEIVFKRTSSITSKLYFIFIDRLHSGVYQDLVRELRVVKDLDYRLIENIIEIKFK